MTAKTPRRRSKTARELAARFGVTPRTICNYAAEPRDEFLARAKERRAHAIALRTQGLSLREVADQMGGTFEQVKRLLRDARRLGEMPAVDGRTKQARAERAALRATAEATGETDSVVS